MHAKSWVEFLVAARPGAPAAPENTQRRAVRLGWSIGLVVLVASLVIVASHVVERLDTGKRLHPLLNAIQGKFTAEMTPMACSTAISFALCGLVLWLSSRPVVSGARHTALVGLAAFVVGSGLFVLVPFALGVRGVQHPIDLALPLSFKTPLMSEFTAALFVVSAVASLATLARASVVYQRLASVCVCALAAVSLLFLLGHAYRVELFRQLLNLEVGVALLTSLAFLLLSVGLIAALGPARFPLRPFVGDSPRAMMLRWLLPVVVGFLLLDAWVRSILLIGVEPQQQVLTSALLALVSAIVVTGLIGVMSMRIGATIDDAEAMRDEALNQMIGTIEALGKTREDLVKVNQQAAEANRQLTEANKDLAIERDKAKEAAVAKDFFLATVSHELRTPLNHVIGFVQLLEMTGLDDDQQRDLAKIHKAANNLLELVNDLLDFQKMIQGALTLEPSQFYLRPFVEELADAMGPKFAEKGNKLVIDCPPDIGGLEADEKRARQALTNLLSNAGKFTRAGTITVALRRQRDGENDWLRIDVIDTGLGMTPEQQSKLFQPFTKLLSRSENPEGTGLGLALSQRLCRLMGGDLTLSRSELGLGSTFTIRLPVARVVSEERPSFIGPRQLPPSQALNGSAKKTSVLVIDDEPEVRELMRRHLGGQGFLVHLAASGAEGLEMVKRLQPDAITLDVLMPGIDGWGTLAALQNDAETAHIPVILITMLDDRKRGFALGAWEVLTKPVSWAKLIDLLRNVEPNTGPVLVIDDDPSFREMGERTLQENGWEVVMAGSGPDGLEAAAKRRPALVLLDLMMPGMDGFTFLDRFRAEPAWRDVPVVVVTAKDLTDEENRRLEGRVLGILSKGMCSPEDMLREIERLLPKPTNKERPVLVQAEPAGVSV